MEAGRLHNEMCHICFILLASKIIVIVSIVFFIWAGVEKSPLPYVRLYYCIFVLVLVFKT